ncbi:MAG: hypothetical protein QXO78_03745 [Desulfurococcaceae archaeon]|uniref:Uncharacterized protein n=1 Tax=Staphylothermus marinus TaxID=2280 RepID=A0A7C4NP29_STAMA
MYKLFVKIKHNVDSYDISIDKYRFDNGKLVETQYFNNVKQINIVAKQITISKQLSGEPLVLIVESHNPVINLISNSILVIRDEEG